MSVSFNNTHICSSPMLYGVTDSVETFKSEIKDFIQQSDLMQKAYSSPRFWEMGAVRYYSMDSEDPMLPILREIGFEELTCGPLFFFSHHLPELYDKLGITKI